MLAHPADRRAFSSLALLLVALAGCGGGGGGDTPAATYQISGTVSGAAAVTVTLTSSSITPRTATTAAGGGYAFATLAPGSYTVTPSLAGFTFVPESITVVVASADRAGQDFTAHQVVAGSRTISGTLTGPTISGVTVTLGGAASATTTSDATGHFAFADLAAGAYVVSPSAMGTLFAPQVRTATVAATDVVLGAFAGEALVAYPGLTGATLDGHLWNGGATAVKLDAGTALLSDAVTNVQASTGYPVSLRVAPEALTGQVTALQATIKLDAISATGDTTSRAGLDLVFQPLADRVGGGDNQTHALYVRLSLFQTGSGALTVRPQVFECTSPDCSTSASVGTASAGATWFASGAAAAVGTTYTAAIAIDPAARTATFSLNGGATPLSATVDLSGGSPPFAVDLSSANALRTRLFAQVRGGSAGGGDGAVAARFGAVKLGQGGAALATFDDFSSGTRLDPARWSVGEESATPVASSPASLQLVLDQAGRGHSNALAVTSTPRALQAQVTVTTWTQTGPGQLGARVSAALYNDGTNGLGTAPDVKGASSQVGDVNAQISVTATDVSWTVVRCNVAVCAQATGAGRTFLKERTSLGSVAVGEPHVLRLAWDAASHTVSFQLDGRPPVVFDPVAAGAPVAGAPAVPYWHVATHTSASATGVEYGSGSSGRIAATFQDLRSL